MTSRSRRKKPHCKEDYIGNDTKKVDKSSNRLALADVLCCVCRSVLVEPVSLPCNHRFCRSCWLATDALRCPLCRKRVGSWLRESARRNHLVDEELWRKIRDQFSTEISNKINGVDIEICDVPLPKRLSAPGEIRAEYEAELERLKAERIQIEQKSSHDTALLIHKLQEEEEQAHKIYLEKLKQDEELARKLQEAENSLVKPSKQKIPKKKSTLDRFLLKKPVQKVRQKESPTKTVNVSNTSSATTTSSQELPAYRSFLEDCDYLKSEEKATSTNKQLNSIVKMWEPPKNTSLITSQKEFSFGAAKVFRTKGAQKQLCPDPLPHVNQPEPVAPRAERINKHIASVVRASKREFSTGSDSVDSMRQELCYFKPIETTISSSRMKTEELVRVPALKGVPACEPRAVPSSPPDLVRGLRLLRGRRPSQDVPSAFVCLLELQECKAEKCDISEVKIQLTSAHKSPNADKHIYSFRTKPVPKHNMSKSDKYQKLRRTRSTSNLSKLMKDLKSGIQTPKRIHTPPRSRKSKSDSKLPNKLNFKQSPFKYNKINARNVKAVAKNLTSPLEKCNILNNNMYGKETCEDYGPENNNNLTQKKSADKCVKAPNVVKYTNNDKLEQERLDFELALRMEAEWNAGYTLRRAPVKRRQPASLHPLMIARAKKMKV